MSACFCIFSFTLKEVNVIIQGSVKLDSPYVGLLELPPASQSYPPGDIVPQNLFPFPRPNSILYSKFHGLLKLIFHTNQYNGAEQQCIGNQFINSLMVSFPEWSTRQCAQIWSDNLQLPCKHKQLPLNTSNFLVNTSKLEVIWVIRDGTQFLQCFILVRKIGRNSYQTTPSGSWPYVKWG